MLWQKSLSRGRRSFFCEWCRQNLELYLPANVGWLLCKMWQKVWKGRRSRLFLDRCFQMISSGEYIIRSSFSSCLRCQTPDWIFDSTHKGCSRKKYECIIIWFFLFIFFNINEAADLSLTRRKTAPPQRSIKVLTGCHGAPLTVILTLNGNNACLKSVGGNKPEGVSPF